MGQPLWRGETRSRFLGFLFVLSLAVLAGCATAPARAQPEFAQRSRNIKTVALVPPEVKVYSLSAGGVREQMDDWSGSARENIVNAIARHSGPSSAFVLKEFHPVRSPAAHEEFQDVRPLSEAAALQADLSKLRPAGLAGYPPGTVVVMRAGFLIREGLYCDARQELLSGISGDPTEPTLRLLLGQVYHATGLQKWAAREFDEARDLLGEKP